MRVSLEGVGTLPEMDVEIDGITVIAGKNSTGKSTVLKTVYCLLEPSMDFVRKREEEAMKTVEELCRKTFLKGVTQDIRFEFKLIDRYIDDLSRQNLQPSDMDSLKTVIALRSGEIDDVFHNTLVTFTIAAEFGDIRQLRSRNGAPMASVELTHGNGTSTLRLIDDSITWNGPFDGLPGVVYLDTPFILDERFNNPGYPTHRGRLASIMRREQDPSIVAKITSDRRLGLFEECIRSIAPGRIRFNPNRNSMEYLENGDEPLDVKNLAAGMKLFTVIRLLIETGIITQDTVVLLDEPEIHLHPSWQIALAKALMSLRRGVGCRILLTTHSPLLLRALQGYSGMMGEEITYYHLVRDDEGGVACDPLGADPSRIYDTMADAYDLANNLYYGDGQDGLEP